MFSRPALVLLGVGCVCVLLLVYFGWRLRAVSPAVLRAKSLRERMSDDSGVAMIEFVLVTPILLTITLLLLQTMLVFTGVFYVQYASFAGARTAIVQIPTASTEESNYLSPERSSAKFAAIESAAVLAVMPVSGRESGSNVGVNEIVSGVGEVFAAQGKSEPAWVEKLLAERLYYAMNHTEVIVEKVTPTDGSDEVVFDAVGGLTEFSPKEAVGVRVRHQLALTIPLAGQIYAAVGESGTYQPVSTSDDSPAPPGLWTMIQSRSILTNEGIDRKLPEAPSVPRLN